MSFNVLSIKMILVLSFSLLRQQWTLVGYWGYTVHSGVIREVKE